MNHGIEHQKSIQKKSNSNNSKNDDNYDYSNDEDKNKPHQP